MEIQRIYDDPQVGKVVLRKRVGVRRVSIRVSRSRGVSVTLPFMVSYDEAIRFFLSKREWVLKTMEKQRDTAPAKILSAQEVEQLRRQAAEYLPLRLARLAKVYGFQYSTLRLKHNRTNWGSCSSRNNINLNISLMFLPPVLRDYVILHELCHLRHHDHSRAFHLLLEHLLTDHLLKLMASHPASDSASHPASATPPADVQLATKIVHAAAKSRAQFPIDHICSTLIRRYHP